MTRGFLAVDKPSGISSNAVVGKVKSATGIKKVGHAGTLDPMATGVVVVAVGPVTRLIRYVQDQPKEYLATAEFGVSTDTLDADGAILERVPMDITRKAVEETATRFVGELMQVPPMVSALKHGGRRLYELAREGTVIERDARPVVVHELEILSVGSAPYPEVAFRVVCGKGTYVRSLADDIAAALGGHAHLTALQRTRIGSITLEAHGVTLDGLASWEDFILSPSEALADLGEISVGDEVAAGVRNGTPFVGGEMSAAPEDAPFKVLDATGGLLAIYRRTGEAARPEVVLAT